jgi:uncharacterized OsmC-like protein
MVAVLLGWGGGYRRVDGTVAIGSALVLSERRPLLPARPQGVGCLPQRPAGLSGRPPLGTARTAALATQRHATQNRGLLTAQEDPMALADIAAAQQRVVAVLRKRPAAGQQDDLPARVSWEGELRSRAIHPQGTEIALDMPAEIGGAGMGVTPGWLLRSALASCAVTRIAMLAAAEGLVLATLEAEATSRSDARGLMGLAEADDSPVPAGPLDVQLQVRIGAVGVTPERLRALVAATVPLSPVTCALTSPVAVTMQVQVEKL